MAELNLNLYVPKGAYHALSALIDAIAADDSDEIKDTPVIIPPPPPVADTPPPPPPETSTTTAPPPPPPVTDAPPPPPETSTTDAPPPPVGEVDATGMPWDARIHASTKTKTVKNTWKYKKGAKDLIASVEAELRGILPAAADTTSSISPDELATQITTMVATDKVPYESVMAILAANGITVMADVRNHGDAVAAKIYEEICNIQ